MFVSRSEWMVRTKARPWVAAASFLALLCAALLALPPAARAAASPAKNRAKAAADSATRAESGDEGISVRVIDGEKGAAPKHTRASRKAASRAETGTEDGEETDTPDTPDTPDKPDKPDHGHDNDLVRFGQDIEIPSGKVIDGSVVAMGGSITVRGRVKGDCTAVGGSVSVRDSAVVEGSAVSVGGSTTVSENARVLGDNVSVGGWHARGMLPFMGLVGIGAALAGIFGTIGQLLLTILLAWLCLLVVRERLQHAVDRMGSQFGKSFLWGLVAWMAMIVVIPAIVIVGAIAMVILVITIIGIPVAILLAIAMVFALIGALLGIFVFAFLGYVNGAMYLGRKILSRRSPGVPVSPIWAVVVGAAVILGLKLVGHLLGFLGLVLLMPIGIALGIASVILGVVFMTAGMGSMVLTRFAKGPLARPAAPAPPDAGWYSPPPAPSAASPPTRPAPEGGSSDAP